MTRICRSSLLLAAALSLAPGAARAQAPLPRSVDVGAPPRSVALELADSGEGPTLRAGRAEARLPLPAVEGATVAATVESVEVAPGHRVAIVRAELGDARAAAVVAMDGRRPGIVWTGRTDLHGDPGERTADVLTLEDRTSDGRPDVVVGLRREGATLCGEDDTLLMPRAYDPGSGRMRPVVLARVRGDTSDAITVTATRESPGPSGPPLLRSLSPTGASSHAGHGDATQLAPPRALTDGRMDTFWAEGRGGPGTGELATLRWTARFPIHAFAIVASATGEAGPQLGRPRRFWLVGESGRVRVQMPEDAGLHPGERYWIVPPSPLDWRCVSLVLDEAYAPAGVRDAAVHTGVAELEAYTELDFGRGLEGLVAILVEGGSGGDEATRLLSGLGEEALALVAAAWPRLDEQGRRRAVRVFATGARRDIEAGIDALATAGRDEAEPVRMSALEALGTLGPRAAEYLGELIREPAPVGDDAVRPLLRHPPAQVVPALLAAIEAPGGSDRPTLREGLARSLARGDGEARGAFESWADAEPPIAALASALLGLADYGPSRSLARDRVAAATARAEEFADVWRLVRAARDLPSAPEVDAWLASIARDADEWMLRAAAVQALERREAPDRLAVAQAALGDDYPRVRVQAVRILDQLDEGDDRLIELAGADSWPMVREAAVEALWSRPAGRDAVRRAARDRSPRVRTTAIRGLTRAGDEEAWPLVRARLADGDEWPQVTVAALRYVRTLCVEGAEESVLAVLRRGLEPDAWAPDVDVAAVAVDLALVLGGELAETATRLASRPDAPAQVRAALERRQRSPARCGE
ncbi:MAG: HEAT repeat domain-containing protein [Myxococcota bacterium]|nr:HEAT repeat domain-containing protein [Myxococcota bacterium]